ncbi:hypothetical protein [Desulfovibrio falkowii]|uniref:Tail protein n=1 Tax=Desulfovibrio falkowii TaxID=3136602 RepID=A0ABQ0E9Y1_9BACT
MHRIDSSTATPDGRFTEGNPTIPVAATTVTDDWLNAVQEELIAILAAAGIAPDKTNNAQVVDAINALIIDMTPIASVGVNGLVNPDGVTIKIDATGKISAITQSMDPVGGIRFFEDNMPRPGYVECNAGIVTNVSTRYPQMAAYLETSYGKSRLVESLAAYEALHVATWHTNADGTKVGWQGIGGVTKFYWDKTADTLKMPDLQDMFQGAAGPSLGVGGVQGDESRNVRGAIINTDADPLTSMSKCTATGALYYAGMKTYNSGVSPTSGDGAFTELHFETSRDAPTGPAFAPRRWGALACAYLGHPTL